MRRRERSRGLTRIVRRGSAHGFTLIEALLAVMLTSLVVSLSVMALWGLRSSLVKARDVLTEEALREQALVFMEREILCATLGFPAPQSEVLPEIRDALEPWSHTFTLTRESVRGRPASRLRFVSMAQYTLPGGARTPATMEIEYAVVPSEDTPDTVRLVRIADSLPDGVYDDDREGETLLDGLLRATFTVYSGETWQEAYTTSLPPGAPPGTAAQGLPNAVRLEMVYPDADGGEGESFRRTWILSTEAVSGD